MDYIGVHSAGTQPPPLEPSVLRQRASCKDSAFASLRFDGVVPLEAAQLAAGMAQRGASLEIINMVGGGDIDAAVIDGIEHCDTFIVFGSQKYGEDTGNNACTYYESKFAKDRNKRIILIRMIPFDAEFEFSQARFMFGLNKLALPWMLGTPMPVDLVDKILEAMEIGGGGAQPEPEPAPLVTAGAWPVELAELTSIPSFAAALAELEVHSIADFAECIDVDEGHDTQLQTVLDALPSKPRKNKLLRNRAQKQLADLLQRLALFIEFDTEEEGTLSRVDCLRIPVDKMHMRVGGDIGEHFDKIDANKDGRVDFQEMYEHTQISEGEGVPPDASHSEAEARVEQERAKVAEEAQALESQRALMEEQAAALQAQQAVLVKMAATVEAEKAQAAEAMRKAEQEASAKRLAQEEQAAKVRAERQEAERLTTQAQEDAAAAKQALAQAELQVEPEPEPELESGGSVQFANSALEIRGHPTSNCNGVYVVTSEHEGRPVLKNDGGKHSYYCFFYAPTSKWQISSKCTPDKSACSSWIAADANGVLPTGRQTWQVHDDGWTDHSITAKML